MCVINKYKLNTFDMCLCVMIELIYHVMKGVLKSIVAPFWKLYLQPDVRK